MKILIFANCHGALYKDALNLADKAGRLEVEHIVSYDNISKFDEIKSKFSQCVILIIQPIQNYEVFKLDNLKSLLKKDCTIIRVPFVRFEGFWDSKDIRSLSKFTSPAVMFFPNISDAKKVPQYLRGDNCSEQDIVRMFDSAMIDLKKLELQGDIKFFDFFASNYKSFPMFRDSYHPTRLFYDFLSHQIVSLVKRKETSLLTSNFEIHTKYKKEYGHFKPIINKVASVLDLHFDLNSYFQYTRYDYLNNIINYENSAKLNLITDLFTLKKIMDTTTVLAINVKTAGHVGPIPNGLPVDLVSASKKVSKIKQLKRIYIVTPSFNSKDTIDRTIISVLSQCGDFEIFYHVQDGGSTDSTLTILEAWKNRIENDEWPTLCNGIHFSFDSKPDGGMYDAIAKSFDVYNSADDASWYSWINSDDFFYPGSFSLLTKIDIDDVLSSAISWVTGCAATNHGGLQASTADRLLSKQVISKGLADGKYWGFVQQEGTFFRKSLWDKIDKVEGFSNLKYAGDWNLWRQFSKLTEIYQYKFPLGSFSVREGQLSQISRTEYENEIEQIVKEQDRLKSFLALDANNINTNYLIPAWHDGKITIESKSIWNHFKYRMVEVLKVQPSKVRNEKVELIPESRISSPQYEDGFVVHDGDWQYPAITEHYAYQKLRESVIFDINTVYVAFPWATLIDFLNTKKPGSDALITVLTKFQQTLTNKSRIVTVCQHILMLNYQNTFAKLGVTDVFWTHAVKGQTCFPNHPHIKIHPFPLYPVQAIGVNDVKGSARTFLYSFVGSKSDKWYLTRSRSIIIDTLSNDPRGIIIGRDQWHYQKIVYSHQIYGDADPKSDLVDTKASDEFKNILLKSIFSLCPSGSGPNSIRLWESIGYDAIPVILADTYLPPGNLDLWKQAAVFCEETEEAIQALPDRLEEMAKDPVLLASKRHAMRQLWMMYGPDCFVYDIQKFSLSDAAKTATSVHWQDSAIDAMVTAVLTSKGTQAEVMRLLLLGCSSRIISSPAYFSERYRQDGRLREALQLAMQQAPAEAVQRVKKVSALRNVVLTSKVK